MSNYVTIVIALSFIAVSTGASAQECGGFYRGGAIAGPEACGQPKISLRTPNAALEQIRRGKARIRTGNGLLAAGGVSAVAAVASGLAGISRSNSGGEILGGAGGIMASLVLGGLSVPLLVSGGIVRARGKRIIRDADRRSISVSLTGTGASMDLRF